MIALIVVVAGLLMTMNAMQTASHNDAGIQKDLEASRIAHELLNYQKAYKCTYQTLLKAAGVESLTQASALQKSMIKEIFSSNKISFNQIPSGCKPLGMSFNNQQSYHSVIENDQLYVWTASSPSTSASEIHRILNKTLAFGVKQVVMHPNAKQMTHTLMSPLSNKQVGADAPVSIPNGALVLIGK